MAFADNSLPVLGVENSKKTLTGRLMIAAATLAAASAVSAFFLLLARDHGHVEVMVNDQTAQHFVPEPPIAAPAVVTPATEAPALVSTPARPKPDVGQAQKVRTGRNSFVLLRSASSQDLGPLRVKLTRIDERKLVYDLGVRVGGRASMHKNLKIGIPLWITPGKAAVPVEFVVTRIALDRVSGYWIQSGRTAQIRTSGRKGH